MGFRSRRCSYGVSARIMIDKSELNAPRSVRSAFVRPACFLHAAGHDGTHSGAGATGRRRSRQPAICLRRLVPIGQGVEPSQTPSCCLPYPVATQAHPLCSHLHGCVGTAVYEREPLQPASWILLAAPGNSLAVLLHDLSQFSIFFCCPRAAPHVCLFVVR